ncbi:lysophospholipid acyltransferase family protein [Kouleothrix sp.]|uniref:lysophospholipid acyltransferase family protein n=1 Tax=Kouleothrix sp. TaxID=2779161 RepID=UPI00391B133E
MLGAFMYFCIWLPLNIVRRVWWNWKVEGVENLPPRGQGMIVVVNHIHWTDIHILGASLPLSHRPWWIAKIEMFLNPVVTWWLRQMQVIPIKRGKRDMAAMDAAEDALKSGAVLIVFPEGHRSRDGGLIEGRGGAVRLAVRTEVPIVPVAVWGTERGLAGAARRAPIRLKIGPPYYVGLQPNAKIPMDRMAELTDEVMLRIGELLPSEYWGIYRERLQARVAGLPAEQKVAAS